MNPISELITHTLTPVNYRWLKRKWDVWRSQSVMLIEMVAKIYNQPMQSP